MKEKNRETLIEVMLSTSPINQGTLESGKHLLLLALKNYEFS